jgi:hypothetical protein
MVSGVITRAIVCKPIGSRHWQPEHEQLSLMSRDNGAFRYELGSGHALAQMVRHARSVLKRDPQKHDDAATAGKLVSVAVPLRGFSPLRAARAHRVEVLQKQQSAPRMHHRRRAPQRGED